MSWVNKNNNNDNLNDDGEPPYNCKDERYDSI